MVKINPHFWELKSNYLFVEIKNRTNRYLQSNNSADIIYMGIGDVTLPLSKTVVKALHDASDEMSRKDGFKGYGPYEGYDFLRNAISKKYKDYGVSISADEIYVSDGSKSDTANIIDIFSSDLEVLIIDPVYPVYRDASILNGNKIKYLNATQENNFSPLPFDGLTGDIIYICSPNNPTGTVYSKLELKQWVDFALKNNSLIIFDAAYEAFIDDPELPHSIFEIPGARHCCIEACSFSKSAGFTGMRCAYLTIPKELNIGGVSVGDIWLKRQAIKFNGVSYITQKAAEAALSEEGKKEISDSVRYYKQNGKILSETLDKLGIWNIGGKNSPYIWFKCPATMSSWETFDFLLKEANIVTTPGSGFGQSGEGFVRLSSFASYENVVRAAKRLENLKF